MRISRTLWRRPFLTALVTVTVTLSTAGWVQPATAAPPPVAAKTGPAGKPGAAADPDRVTDPDHKLGRNWRREADRIVTTAADETGLHLLVADRQEAYHWRTAATLVEPGIDTDQWIGQYCVTGSQQRAVVVYAPRQFANHGELLSRGAFAAVVDLGSGAVTKLPELVTLAYYNPACGAGETAVLSRLEGDDEHPKTWFTMVDAATGKLSHTVRAAGELTSALPVGDRIVAATGAGLVEVRADGATKLLAATGSTPFRVVPDGRDGVAFEVAKADRTSFLRYTGGTTTTVGTAPNGRVRLRSGPAGRVVTVGVAAAAQWGPGRPGGWLAVDASPDAEVSSAGRLVVTSAASRTEAAGASGGAAVDGHPDRVRIEAKAVGGDDLTFALDPAASPAGAVASPALVTGGAGPQRRRLAGDPSTMTTDPDRTCAVPRNDPAIQVYQPTPKQVEWAADLAVRGMLTFSRPADWLHSGLPSWSPQVMFPPASLHTPDGSTGYVPAQVMLGILAQESNLRQASWHVVDGSSGNPLTPPGFYGLNSAQDPNSVNFAATDCGYGVGQLTTGMRTVDTNATGGLSDLQQRAAALDYATNIAASVRLLQDKWNQLYDLGITANNAQPQYIENWFFAVWAYNTGVHDPQPNNPGGQWGLGWLNNPANPIYPKDRQPYLTRALVTPAHHDEIAYDNAKHPSDWSYPERIMGYAHTSVILPDYADGGRWKSTYATGLWKGGTNLGPFLDAQPPLTVACVAAANRCDPAAPPHQSTDPAYSGEPPGPCQENDLTRCWWHTSAVWQTDCPTTCGIEKRTYTSVEPRPYATNIHPEQCNVVGLSNKAIIIDDIGTTKPLGPDGCPPVAPGGELTWKFGSANGANGTIYPSKVDFHQIGGGFGGHFWFAHTQSTSSTNLQITGTWTPANRLDGWVQVMVHLPDTGAWTQQAHYVIHTGGADRERYLPTNRGANTWVQLGTYQFTGAGVAPQGLELSNLTFDGQGNQDIAWDAAAFVPLGQKPAHFVVAIGDSYESGEGAGNYYAETDKDYTGSYWNACRRSTRAWPRLTTLPGQSSSIGSMADTFDSRLDFQNVSCSGAKAVKMTGTSTPYWSTPQSPNDLHYNAEGQFFERDQTDSGVLSDDTTLVLLSAGGNDAGFPTVMGLCGDPSQPSCTARQGDFTQRIQAAQTPVRELIDKVHAKAKYAQIVLVGYPRLIAVQHDSGCGPLAFFDSGEMDMLNQLAETMRQAQLATVNAANGPDGRVSFIDMVPGFGDYGACRVPPQDGLPVIPEYINEAMTGPTGPGDFQRAANDADAPCWGWYAVQLAACISRSSFHPKDAGQVQYAGAVTSGLVTVGYH